MEALHPICVVCREHDAMTVVLDRHAEDSPSTECLGYQKETVEGICCSRYGISDRAFCSREKDDILAKNVKTKISESTLVSYCRCRVPFPRAGLDVTQG